MHVITGKFILDSASEVAKMLDALVGRVERSRGRAGCIDYQFAQSLVDPCEILLMEKWASQGDLDAHMAIPDPEFSEVLASVRIRSVQISVCEAGEERVMMER